MDEYNESIKHKFPEFKTVMTKDRIITRGLFSKISNNCLNQIGNEYLRITLNKALLKLENGNYNIDIHYEIVILQKKEEIGGFLVVKKGLCSRIPTQYGISLICSSVKGGGSLLMGLYLYTILSRPDIPQTGLLELAAAFNNGPGLCMYEKFGFRQDTKLFGKDCFDDPLNLPMSFQLQEYYTGSTVEEKKANLMEIVLGKPVSKTPFCSLQGGKQKSLALIKNILLIMDYPNPQTTIIRTINDIYYDLYNTMQTNLSEEIGTEANLKTVKEFLVDYISFLEGGIEDDETNDYYEGMMEDNSSSAASSSASLSSAASSSAASSSASSPYKKKIKLTPPRGKTWKHLKQLNALKRASTKKRGKTLKRMKKGKVPTDR